ncbi:Succinate dehydrogenase/fumarate reductase, flavoprotein subunit [Candidatus Paraburkholderia calva]|nr:Succinate dehydrogenase/fumarate reductase, flavoprotein subunit [Candidatus Paraburkholderia calva]
MIVCEKEDVFGGPTAWSSGWTWIPRNPPAKRAGIVEDADAPHTYLKNELGAHYDAAKADALIEHGPRMVEFFERHTALCFIDGNRIPDFHTTQGAATGGRSVCAMPFDGRELGALIGKLRPPLEEMTIKGMAIASGQDLAHFLNATRNARSAWHVTKRFAAFAWHALRHGRSMHLVNGNALVARLLKSAADRGVQLKTGAKAVALIRDGKRVSGARVEIDGVMYTIEARRGVVLACGGYPHDPKRQAQTFAYTPHWSAAPKTNTGDGTGMGEAVGARFDGTLEAAAAWAPVSLVPEAGGTSRLRI